MVEIVMLLLVAALCFWAGSVARSLERLRLDLEHDDRRAEQERQQQIARSVMPTPEPAPEVETVLLDQSESQHTLSAERAGEVDVRIDGRGGVHWGSGPGI